MGTNYIVYKGVLDMWKTAKSHSKPTQLAHWPCLACPQFLLCLGNNHSYHMQEASIGNIIV